MITNYKKIIFTLLVPSAFFGISNSGSVFTYKNNDRMFFKNSDVNKAITICNRINDEISVFTTKPVKEIVAKKQDLTFEVLKEILKEKTSDEKNAVFEYLKTDDGRYNVLGYLASDNFLYEFIGEEGTTKEELAKKVINFDERTLSKKQDLTFEILFSFCPEKIKKEIRSDLKKRKGKYTLEMFIFSDQFLDGVFGKENINLKPLFA